MLANDTDGLVVDCPARYRNARQEGQEIACFRLGSSESLAHIQTDSALGTYTDLEPYAPWREVDPGSDLGIYRLWRYRTDDTVFLLGIVNGDGPFESLVWVLSEP